MFNIKQLDSIKELELIIDGLKYLIKRPRVINNNVYMVFRREGNAIESSAQLNIDGFDGSQEDWEARCIRKLLDIFHAKDSRLSRRQ